MSGPSRAWTFRKRARDGLRRYLDNVRHLASDAAALEVHPIFLTQPILYDAPVHFDTAGATLVAEEVAKVLLSHGIVTTRTSTAARATRSR